MNMKFDTKSWNEKKYLLGFIFLFIVALTLYNEHAENAKIKSIKQELTNTQTKVASGIKNTYKMKEYFLVNSKKYAVQDAYYSITGATVMHIGIYSEDRKEDFTPSFYLADENNNIYERRGEFENDWIDWWKKNGVNISYYITFAVPAKHDYNLIIQGTKDPLNCITIVPKYRKEALEFEKSMDPGSVAN